MMPYLKGEQQMLSLLLEINIPAVSEEVQELIDELGGQEDLLFEPNLGDQ